MLLRQVELALLLKTRASVMLAQGPELGPLLGELLCETALRVLDGAGRVVDEVGLGVGIILL